MNNEIAFAHTAQNEAFTDYGELLVRYHLAKAIGDDEAAREYRDRMDIPAESLSPAEVEWLGALSGDLYMLHSGEVFLKLDRSPQQWLEDLRQASNQNDGDQLLSLLRMGSSWPKDHIAYFRSRAYSMLGYKELALLFMLSAVAFAPQRDEYQVLLLGLLSELGKKDVARDIALETLRRQNTLPQLRIYAACILFMSTHGMPNEESQDVFEQAIKAIASVLESPHALSSLTRKEAVMAWLARGCCEKALGDSTRALASFDTAVEIDPRNEAALVLRGETRQRYDLIGALADFEEVVKLGTEYPVPYLVLSRHALMSQNYVKCKKLCSKLIAITTVPRIRAMAFDFLAIAYTRLGKPNSKIKTTFENALLLDPQSETIRANYRSYSQAASQGLKLDEIPILESETYQNNLAIPASDIQSLLDLIPPAIIFDFRPGSNIGVSQKAADSNLASQLA